MAISRDHMRLLPSPAATLPPFTSLLIHGPYPPSTLIHLALSTPTILFSPSRDHLLHALHNSPDEWLTTRSGTGAVASISSTVTLFYPASPKHLLATLVMLRTHDSSVPITQDVALERAPNVLVLHEPSAYFLREHLEEEYTLSSYFLLITHALSTIEYLSSTASLVVFDSGLDQLKLPVLRSPAVGVFGRQDALEDAPRPEPVLFLAKKYFELSGKFQFHGQTESDLRTPVFVLHRFGEVVVEMFQDDGIVD